MQVVHQHCAGLDVHKKTVVACVITPKEKGRWEKEIRTFSTMTKDLLNLSDWLTSKGGLVRSEYERCNAILAKYLSKINYTNLTPPLPLASCMSAFLH